MCWYFMETGSEMQTREMRRDLRLIRAASSYSRDDFNPSVRTPMDVLKNLKMVRIRSEGLSSVDSSGAGELGQEMADTRHNPWNCFNVGSLRTMIEKADRILHEARNRDPTKTYGMSKRGAMPWEFTGTGWQEPNPVLDEILRQCL